MFNFRKIKNPTISPWNITLFIVIIFHICMRIPTLVEPTHSDDVNFYLTVGKAMFHGFVLFRDISDMIISRPGLIYVIAGLCGSFAVFQTLTLIINTANIILFLTIVRKFVKTTVMELCAGVAFVLFTSTPLLLGNQSRDELYEMTCTLGALLLLTNITYTENERRKDVFLRYFFLGVLSGLAILMKVNALLNFISIIISVYILSQKNSRYSKQLLNKVLLLVVGCVIPIMLFFGVLFVQGLQIQDLVMMYTNTLEFALDAFNSVIPALAHPYNKLVIAGFLSVVVYLLRRKIKSDVIIVSIWTLFTIVTSLMMNVIGIHYTLQTVPAIILIIVIIASNTSSINKFVVSIPLIIFVLAVLNFSTINRFKKVIPYYVNFYSYVTGALAQDEYYRSFSYEIPRNYQVAQLVKTIVQPNDKIVVWGNQTEIYMLSGTLPSTRFIWPEYINTEERFKQTMALLRTVKPKVIVLFNDNKSKSFHEDKFLSYIQCNYHVFDRVFTNDDQVLDSAAILYVRD